MEKIEIDKLTIKNCYEIINFLDGMVNPSDLSDEQKLAINLLLIELKGLIKTNVSTHNRIKRINNVSTQNKKVWILKEIGRYLDMDYNEVENINIVGIFDEEKKARDMCYEMSYKARLWQGSWEYERQEFELK